MLEGEEQEIIRSIREQAMENESLMRGCAGKSSQAWGEESIGEASTFPMRLLLAILLWGVFVWNHLEGREVLGFTSEQVVETISQDVSLQDIENFVRIEDRK